MQQFCTLGKISKKKISKMGIFLVLCLALVTFGCATGKNLIETESGFSATAAGTPEGILLRFYNIPEDATLLSVTLDNVTTNDGMETFFDSGIAFDGDELAELRKSQSLLCPFVKNGHEYKIFIHCDAGINNKTKQDKNPKNISLSAVAGGGVSPINDPLLQFNADNNGLILSAKPAFSGGALYSQDHSLFSYWCFGIKPDDKSFYGGFNVYTDELTCDVSRIYNVYNTYQQRWGLTGDEGLSIMGFVYCTMNYGNLKWDVRAAKTEEIIVSL